MCYEPHMMIPTSASGPGMATSTLVDCGFRVDTVTAMHNLLMDGCVFRNPCAQASLLTICWTKNYPSDPLPDLP